MAQHREELEFDESHYRTGYLVERGFVRRRCQVCGKHFWTLDPDSDNCNEAPCVPYDFIGRPPTSRSYSLEVGGLQIGRAHV